MQGLKTKWLVHVISGLLLIGVGLSAAIESGIYKWNHPERMVWLLYGTISLVVFNSGLCVFAKGILYKIKMEVGQKTD